MDPIKAEFLLKGITDVSSERIRQITEEGHGAENDDVYTGGELAIAGACYAALAAHNLSPQGNVGPIISGLPIWWPFKTEAWRPVDSRQNLVKAAALIIAEIDRVDRDLKKKTEQQKMP
jgi:hypothetical protein